MQSTHANDFNNVTQTYIKELSDSKYSPLPWEVEKKLIQDAQNGDEKSKNIIIESHLRFVVSTVKKYKGLGLEMSDLIQEGNMALFEALKRFDIKKDVRFCIYAKWWIEKYVKMALDSNKAINDNELVINCVDEDGKSNDNADFTNSVESHEKKYETHIEDDYERNKENSEIVENLLSSLDKRTRLVIEMWYGLNNQEPQTMVEISKKLNISSERVRQIKEKGMMGLRYSAMAQSISLENN